MMNKVWKVFGFTMFTCLTVAATKTPVLAENVNGCEHRNVTVYGAEEPTDTKEGNTGFTFCEDCWEILDEGSVIPALGVEESDEESSEDGEFNEEDSEDEDFDEEGSDEETDDTEMDAADIDDEDDTEMDAADTDDEDDTQDAAPVLPEVTGQETTAPSTIPADLFANLFTWDDSDDEDDDDDEDDGDEGQSAGRAYDDEDDWDDEDDDYVMLKKGTKIEIGKMTFRVTKAGEVEFLGTKASGNVVIPSTIVKNGVTYKVTSIAAKALKGNKKVKKVVIGKYVKKIGADAFRNCKNLKKIDISSNSLKTVGKRAIKNVNKKVVIRCHLEKWKQYKKLFRI